MIERARAIGLGRRRSATLEASRSAEGSRLFAALAALWQREAAAARGPAWLPVAFAAGVLTYFQAEVEPSLLASALVAGLLIALSVAARARPIGFGLAVAAATFATGFAAATLRTTLGAHAVLERPVVATISGYVVSREQRERSDRVVIDVTSSTPALPSLPQRVRLVQRAGSAPPVGSHVAARARWSPPGGPALPGSFDFGRDLWFAGIGATGLALGTPQIVPAPGPMPWRLVVWGFVDALRETISARVRAALPCESGAIAAALITGERDAIRETTNESLRVSGLYHVISISGLHMVIVVGAVLFLIRGALALVPGLALRHPIKKWACVAALSVATGYWLISGAEFATTRAYLMIALVLVGTMIDRVALTLRTLAAAALAVMVVMPDSVLNPGFQMSFAATLALVALYEQWAPGRGEQGASMARRAVGALWLAVVGSIVTSIVAGLATAPFIAFHFHRLSPFGLVSNLLAMPLISAIIMPAALFGVVLMPFGFDRPVWLAMGWGIERMLDVSALVAALPGADSRLAAFDAGALLLAVAALLIGALFVGPLRLLSVPLAVAATLWMVGNPQRPDVLIDASGRLVAVRGVDGRLTIAGAQADRFTARMWLAADGDRRAPNDPSLTEELSCDGEGCVARLQDGAAVAIAKSAAAVEEDCGRAALVVSRHPAPDGCSAIRADAAHLAASGALALRWDGTAWRTTPARAGHQQRPWTGRPAPAPQLPSARQPPLPRSASPPADEDP